MHSDKEFLNQFGWNGFFESQLANFNESELETLVIARIICEERNLYRLQFSEKIKLWGAVTGKMQFEAESREDFPAVGDFVLAEISGERAVIKHVFERKSVLKRKQVGSNLGIQILSTNVDYAFITTSMNEDLNIRRLERYITLVADAGVRPIIVLTKADLCLEDQDTIRQKVQKAFPLVEVYSVAQDSFSEAKFLPELVSRGTTSVFIGSSGVGKSTLVNFLIGEYKMKTQEIREDDDKGKHTTTSRQLFVSRFEGLVIDTPGMRELQLLDHEEGLQSQFEDIEALAQTCRFTDCHHETEPGCAIVSALDAGELEVDRWNSYIKLLKEIRHMQRKQDKALASEDRKAWKKITMMVREKNKR